MKNFFKREHLDKYLEAYVPMMKDKFNASNIESMNRRKVLSYFHAGDEKDFLAYRFDVLNQWMKNNERYVQTYIDSLNKVINNLCLREEFNSFEQQRIIELEGIVFAKWRNLKQLIVDFPLYKDEFVFYRYEIYSFIKIDSKGVKPIENADLYITTKRIVLGKNVFHTTIDYSQMKNYHVSKDSITFELKNGYVYEVKTDNIYAIYVSLERVLKREKIIFN